MPNIVLVFVVEETGGFNVGPRRGITAGAVVRRVPSLNETCERAQGRLFSPRPGLSGSVSSHETESRLPRRGSGRRRRDAESREEDRASTHYHARAAARASQGKHCGCPFRGTTLRLKQQRGVRPGAHRGTASVV